jgi:hypothetical protein
MAGTSPAMTSHCSRRWYCTLDGFSVERLTIVLTALDRDVGIVIRNKPKSRAAGRILVAPG